MVKHCCEKKIQTPIDVQEEMDTRKWTYRGNGHTETQEIPFKYKKTSFFIILRVFKH